MKNLRLWFRLKRLAKGNVEYKGRGICGNIVDIAELPISFVSSNSKDWKYYSGDHLWPIPKSKTELGNRPYAAYHNCANKWDFTTDYGKLRQDLCFHLIKKLEESSFLCKLASKLWPIK